MIKVPLTCSGEKMVILINGAEPVDYPYKTIIIINLTPSSHHI